jgi:phosphate:Na+ symporter
MLLGGLGLFIFGIEMNAEGLQKIAGSQMKKLMAKATRNRFTGALVGALTTAILQSSSFTTLMIAGLVNANVLNITQAASLIIGANVGTTITAQIIAFKISSFALPMIALGVFLKFFTKSERKIFIGDIITGIGMLFLGLNLMQEAFLPLSSSLQFQTFLSNISDNFWMSILSGFLLAALTQSSSASIGVIMALASTGMLEFESSIAMVLGANVGTTLTTIIASMKMNYIAKRAAMLHILFNIGGVLMVIPFFKLFFFLVSKTISDPTNILRGIANAHTLFNIITMCIFLVLLPWLVRTVSFIVPKKKTSSFGTPAFLQGYLKAPDIALMHVKIACVDMLKLTQTTLEFLSRYITGEEKYEGKILDNEYKINTYRNKTSNYLAKIAGRNLTQSQAQSVPVLLHIVNDIETIGDQLKEMALEIKHMREKKLRFSRQDILQIIGLCRDTNTHLNKLISLLGKSSRNHVIALEEELINFRRDKLDQLKPKSSHFRFILRSFHNITRKAVNLLVMTREV